MKEKLKKLGTALLIAYALALTTLPIFWHIYGETQWLLILLRYLPGFVLIAPVPVFTIIAWNRKTTVLGLIVCFIGIFYFMGLELPGRGRDGANLKVMSYNIRAGLGGPDEIADYLLASGVEIIALQEARAPLADPEADPLPALTQTLEGFDVARGGARGELVILSRHKITESREIKLGDVATALEARIDVSGNELRVINLHAMTGDPNGKLKRGKRGRFRWLNVTAKSRAIQFEALSKLAEEQVPTLILGDFNTPPNSDGHKLLSRSLTDCFGDVGAGFGYTFRADVPVWRIDYVWASKELVPCRASVESCQLSDHKPLTVELQW